MQPTVPTDPLICAADGGGDKSEPEYPLRVEAQTLAGHLSESLSLSHFHLPPEIWFAVIKSNIFGTDDLRNVSLTQESFRYMAQPLLFRHIRVSTCTVWSRGPEEGNPKSYQTLEYIERFRTRLDFVTSNRIASAVEDISINGHYTASVTPDLLDGAELFGILFGAIHHFHNLVGLSSVSTVLTTPMIKAVFALPCLHFLRLTWCSLDSTVHPFEEVPQTYVLKFKHLEDYSDTEEALHWWLPLLSKAKTRNIAVSGPLQTSPLLSFIASGAPMRALRKLEVSTTAVAHPRFFGALKNCPSLTFLSFHDPPPPMVAPHFPLPAAITQLLSSDAVPLLDYVHVPPTYAIPFIRARPVRMLHVSSAMSILLTESLIHEIQVHRPKLSQLVISLEEFKLSIFESGLDLPSISWLSLLVREAMSDAELEQVCNHLCQVTKLPQDLYFLVISSPSYMLTTRIRETVETRYPNLDTRFRSECPHLNKFSVSCGSTEVYWTKDAFWSSFA